MKTNILSTILGFAIALSAYEAQASTQCMISLSTNTYQQVIAQSGDTYTSDGYGVICGVTANDVNSLESSGYAQLGISQARSTYNQTTAPTTANDNTQDFGVGSRWLNTANGTEYVMSSTSTNNGQWNQFVEYTKPLGLATQLNTFSVTPSTNPLILGVASNILTASVNATGGYAFLSGVTSRTIYPMNLTVMASGTAATATSEKIVCLPSGNLIATIPITALVTSVPVGVYSSTGSIIPGPAFAQGCQAGDGVYASNVGSNLATTTNLFITMPYTVQ